jgi:CDP-diacylglycerol--glycerol-3-phosphate 3-phosphatidyltransferase
VLPTAGAGGRAAWKERLKAGAHAATEPLVGFLAGAGARPDHLTWAGLALGFAAGVAFFVGRPGTGALVMLAGGLCDVLDGQLARRLGRMSRFGAFLDSVTDRLSEAFVLLGIMGFYLSNLLALVLQPERVILQMHRGLEPDTWAAVSLTAALALAGSFLVSYTRARAEGLGLECKVGWFERPERLALIIVAGLVAGWLRKFWAIPAALMLLALLSFATAAQRVAYVYRHTRRAGVDHLEG